MNQPDLRLLPDPGPEADAYYMQLYQQYRMEEQLHNLASLEELPEDYEEHIEFYKNQTHPS